MTAVNWLPNTLPDRWRVARMIDHVRLLNGYPFDSALFTAEQGTPLVRIRDLGSTTTEVCYAGTPVPEAEIDRGAVLVGMDGDFNVARWAGGKALLNQRVCCLTPCATLDAAFLAFVLPAPLKVINDLTGSTTVKHLSSFDILKIRFPLPPLSVQTRISAHLEAVAGRIDNLLAEKERLLDLLAEKRKAIIATAVTRGLEPKVKLRDSGVPWLGEIPAHWELRRGKYLFRQSSLPVATGDEIVTCFRDGQVTLRRNRREEGFTNADLEVGYQGIRQGQLVLHSMDAFAGAIGVSDSDGRCSPEYIICDPLDGGVVAPEYFGPLLRTMALAGFIQASCPAVRERAPRIRFNNLGEMYLPVPPLDEQRAVVTHIARETAKLDAARAATERTIALLKERRSALIAAAVTGQLDVGAAA